jgi:hypothetical protein
LELILFLVQFHPLAAVLAAVNLVAMLALVDQVVVVALKILI